MFPELSRKSITINLSMDQLPLRSGLVLHSAVFFPLYYAKDIFYSWNKEYLQR